MFIAAGGLIHLREWLNVYRLVPADAPGAAVVRVGFPLNTAASIVIVIALVVVVRRHSRLTQPLIFGALAFQAVALGTLIATRSASVLGWSEPSWTPGADQARAVEIAAIAALLVLAALCRRDRTGLHSDLDAEPHKANDHDSTPLVDPVPVRG